MALVDYSSGSDSDSDSDSGSGPGPESGLKVPSDSSASPAEARTETSDRDAAAPLAKRRKVSEQTKPLGTASSSSLPPLPSAFHDLYASTVRVSTNDDPTLHQGRKRVNPHRAGNWPTHLYIEWHPTDAQRALLTSLLDKIQSSSAASSPPSSSPPEILSFLNSDLGAPQPLHISLSRPIVLSTSQKDGFLERLVASLGKSGVPPFDLAPRALAWHRTAESARSFLVLRVASTSSKPATAAAAATTTTTTTTTASSGGDPTIAGAGAGAGAGGSTNPELAQLLGRCNRLVAEHGQPPLYAPRVLEGGSGSGSGSGTAALLPDDAFHVSVAWSFAEVDSDLRARTEAAFAEPGLRGGVLAARLHVDGVKAKIGNAVTHVPLPGARAGRR
ncbi:poly(U)-specific 3'-to-5' RNA exonuclease [Diatrype stigma]|uniref:U6 snRNA phosphodiesterase n=1 Tax=Diatrype stigma TaxID=117547 RepID=A0AAN9UNE3_9PEZI